MFRPRTLSRPLTLLSLVIVGVLVPVPVRSQGQAGAAEVRALHALNRLAFGPRPGEVERVARLGVERWIEQQLHPERMVDSAGNAALSGCDLWQQPPDTGTAAVSVPSAQGGAIIQLMIGGFRLISTDSARKLGARGTSQLQNNQLVACRLARVEASDQQLLEVLTDFWENHFSIYSVKLPRRDLLVEWDRDVIRANSLGRFRTLLGAVAHSPVMLAYLDNANSSATMEQPTLLEYERARKAGTSPFISRRAGYKPDTGLNENYARELLELHTMGVDAGYSQADVVAVARAFTGWSHTGGIRGLPGGSFVVAVNAKTMGAGLAFNRLGERPVFAFDSARHDAGEKTFLGRTLKSGRGLEDAEEVLDIIARHPATARFISRKLAVRFVSDDPPATLVDRAAKTFLETDGDIRAVVRTIVTSPEFFSPTAYNAKIKSPLELVLSTRRALAAPVDSAAHNVDLLIMLDQPPFGYLTPEGWPETGNDWMNAGALMNRMKMATRIGRGELTSIPLEKWPHWQQLGNAPFDRQVNGVLKGLLYGRGAPEFRKAADALRPARDAADSPEERQRALRELITVALGSPQFQRR